MLDFQATPRTLRSSSRNRLHVNVVRTVFASHALGHATPSVWNNLPAHLTDLSLTQESLKSNLIPIVTDRPQPGADIDHLQSRTEVTNISQLRSLSRNRNIITPEMIKPFPKCGARKNQVCNWQQRHEYWLALLFVKKFGSLKRTAKKYLSWKSERAQQKIE